MENLKDSLFLFRPWINIIADAKVDPYSKFIPAAATLVAALIGSFLGPWIVFKREKKDKEQKIKQDNITAGNLAIFTLMRQFSRLDNICKQIIDPVRTHPLKFVMMRAVLPPLEYIDLKFDINSLSFLLKPQPSKQLQIILRQTLDDLFIECNKFQTAISAINERTTFHIQQVQPLLQKAKIRLYQDSPDTIQMGEEILLLSKDMPKILACFERILGHGIYQRLLQSTNEIIIVVDDTKESLLNMRDKLIDAINQLFPKNTDDILRFKPLENP